MAASQPTVVYVSTSGSNTTGTGSASAPYATISEAVSQVASGGTVMVEPGTYNETVNITQDVNVQADIAAGGTASNTILNATGFSNGIVISG